MKLVRAFEEPRKIGERHVVRARVALHSAATAGDVDIGCDAPLVWGMRSVDATTSFMFLFDVAKNKSVKRVEFKQRAPDIFLLSPLEPDRIAFVFELGALMRVARVDLRGHGSKVNNVDAVLLKEACLRDHVGDSRLHHAQICPAGDRLVTSHAKGELLGIDAVTLAPLFLIHTIDRAVEVQASVICGSSLLLVQTFDRVRFADHQSLATAESSSAGASAAAAASTTSVPLFYTFELRGDPARSADGEPLDCFRPSLDLLSGASSLPPKIALSPDERTIVVFNYYTDYRLGRNETLICAYCVDTSELLCRIPPFEHYCTGVFVSDTELAVAQCFSGASIRRGDVLLLFVVSLVLRRVLARLPLPLGVDIATPIQFASSIGRMRRRLFLTTLSVTAALDQYLEVIDIMND